jgi:hypothetical protein
MKGCSGRFGEEMNQVKEEDKRENIFKVTTG